MAHITDEQIDAAIPPVPDVLPLVAGQPSRAKMNELLKTVRNAAQSYSGTRERFFSSLGRGESFRSRRHHQAVPDYVVGNRYHAGAVVKNAGNLYLASGTNYWVGATAPTGTNNGKLADSTGAWLYLGKFDASAQVNDLSSSPVLSWSVTAAGLQRYDPTVKPGAFLLTGAPFTPASPWGGGTGVSTQASSIGAVAGAVRFVTDAPIIHFNSDGKFETDTNALPAFVVDGFQEMPFGGGRRSNQSVAGNPNIGPYLDFSSRPDRIREVYCEIRNLVFTGVWVPPRSSVWAPQNPHRYRLLCNGDSFMEGGDSGNGALSRLARLGLLLGCDDVWSTAKGNTGFIWAGSGTNFLAADRIAYTIARAPDIIYSAASDWDGGYTSAQRKSAYKQYWDQILAGLPDVVFVMAGGRATAQVDVDMREAVSEYGHAGVIFAPSTPDVGGTAILTGNGSAITVGTTQGNTQWYLGGFGSDEHPNPRGNEYLAWRDYELICAAMRSL